LAAACIKLCVCLCACVSQVYAEKLENPGIFIGACNGHLKARTSFPPYKHIVLHPA
jgi:hypothetical protein